jgi:glycosyl transferase family 25
MTAVQSDVDNTERAAAEGTPRIFYLNLQSRTDRRAAMERQLSELGLRARRIEACTPENLSPRALELYCTPSRARFVSPRELACTLSHRMAWQTIIATNVASALILEDDALLSRRLPAHLPALLALARNWDVVRVEARPEFAVTLGPEIDCGLESLSFRRPLTSQWGSGAYFVSWTGAEKLLRWQDLSQPVDKLMLDPDEKLFRQLSIIQAMPGLCTTPGTSKGDSDLQLARLNRDELMRRQYRRRVGTGLVGRLRHYFLHSQWRRAEERSARNVRRLEKVPGTIRMTIPFGE